MKNINLSIKWISYNQPIYSHSYLHQMHVQNVLNHLDHAMYFLLSMILGPSSAKIVDDLNRLHCEQIHARWDHVSSKSAPI
jgi:hypothetical protein